MALVNPTKTLHAWLRERVRSVCGSRARLEIVGDDWVDTLAESNQRVDLEWGLTPATILSSVEDLNSNRAVLGYSLIGAWSGSKRTLEWTDRQILQVMRLQRSLLVGVTDPGISGSADWPVGVDLIETAQATMTDLVSLVAWVIPVTMQCEVED